MTDVLAAVQTIVADLFELEPEQIKESFSPEVEPRWDSLKHLGIVTAIEDEFELTLEPEEIEEMTNIGAIVKLVASKQ